MEEGRLRTADPAVRYCREPSLHGGNGDFCSLGLNATIAANNAVRVSGRPPMQHSDPHATHVVVLIPAHNEEASIGATVQALLRQERIPDRIVVIADNCTDETIAVAASLRHPALVVTETRNNRDK